MKRDLRVFAAIDTEEGRKHVQQLHTLRCAVVTVFATLSCCSLFMACAVFDAGAIPACVTDRSSYGSRSWSRAAMAWHTIRLG